MLSTQKHSCLACARRKVKCDRLDPCSTCSRVKGDCVYGAPLPSQRHRKRPPDDDLLSKIHEYEELLRKNNVKFQPLDNSWISSSLEESLVPTTTQLDRPPRTLASKTSERNVGAQSPDGQINPVQRPALGNIWFELPQEVCSRIPLYLVWTPDDGWKLRDCSTELLKQPRTEPEADDAEGNNDSEITENFWLPTKLMGDPPLLELHPAPKHIFKLWRAFAEKVEPLTKVIHAPTLQQRILEASWSVETVLRPLEAIMFSIYALGITSMKPSECTQEFGEKKSVLLHRYRSGAARALAAADLHSTRDLEVLQAFVLFLLLDPRSELSVTLVSIAMRIGHKMGLHRTGTDPRISVFEQEMRIRVWWQIMGLESWSRRKVLRLTLSLADYGDVRMPLNINDAELHPHMENLPVEHLGATEMLYCLMKYEVKHHVRSWLAGASIDTVNPYELVGYGRIANRKDIVTDLSKIYQEKYLRHCDPSIPLHRISITTGQLTIHRLRFWFYHPRNQPEGDRNMSQADQDIMFESSIRLLELDYDLLTANFSTHLIHHQALKQMEVDALVYMISELQHRVSGELVESAWSLVERIYGVYPQLLGDDSKFCTALAGVTLKAWQVYSCGSQTSREAVPEFIIALQEKGGNDVHGDMLPAAEVRVTIPDRDFPPWWIDDDPLEWVYWNDLPPR